MTSTLQLVQVVLRSLQLVLDLRVSSTDTLEFLIILMQSHIVHNLVISLVFVVEVRLSILLPQKIGHRIQLQRLGTWNVLFGMDLISLPRANREQLLSRLPENNTLLSTIISVLLISLLIFNIMMIFMSQSPIVENSSTPLTLLFGMKEVLNKIMT